jgi:HlyD family secretion protein
MRKKIIIAGIIIMVSIVTLIVYNSCRRIGSKVEYETAEIKRGDIENTVWGTGSVEPVNVVSIGTEVSGTVDKIFVDFNDEVKKNQILAVLDTTSLSLNVKKAKANLKKAEIAYEHSKVNYENNKDLFERDLISDYEMNSIKVQKEEAYVSYLNAEADLDRARDDLKHAVIRSPVNGTIIDRSVDEGQTVSASLQAPTLFEVAENLENMEIHVYVDESDIGSMKKGQDVRFTVPSYPDKTFKGKVDKVRLKPTEIQNVVKYTVIVSTVNKEKLLLPGMTADVDFIIEDREDVLLIPNSALNMEPTASMLQELQENMKKEFAGRKPSMERENNPSNPDDSGEKLGFRPQPGQSLPEDLGGIFYLDDEGKLKITMIKKGATDGKNTEIVEGRNIKEGMKVITGIKGEKQSESSEEEGQHRGPPGLF